MASRNKKTTMAKLSRESKLRERRLEKAARKEARKQAAGLDAPPFDGLPLDEPAPNESSLPDPSGVGRQRPTSA